MAGYSDTRQLIIDTLMGRPAGTEIQPEDHQAFALALNDYIRSVELVAGSGVPVAFAEPNTVPVQPNNGQAVYLSQVPCNTTKTFSNFINQSGNAISVTSAVNVVKLVTLLWNGSYWSKQETSIPVITDTSSGWIFKGVVIPSFNPPAVTVPSFYIASEPGDYSNFIENFILKDGELVSFFSRDGDWYTTSKAWNSSIMTKMNSTISEKFYDFIPGNSYRIYFNIDDLVITESSYIRLHYRAEGWSNSNHIDLTKNENVFTSNFIDFNVPYDVEGFFVAVEALGFSVEVELKFKIINTTIKELLTLNNGETGNFRIKNGLYDVSSGGKYITRIFSVKGGDVVFLKREGEIMYATFVTDLNNVETGEIPHLATGVPSDWRIASTDKRIIAPSDANYLLILEEVDNVYWFPDYISINNVVIRNDKKNLNVVESMFSISENIQSYKVGFEYGGMYTDPNDINVYSYFYPLDSTNLNKIRLKTPNLYFNTAKNVLSLNMNCADENLFSQLSVIGNGTIWCFKGSRFVKKIVATLSSRRIIVPLDYDFDNIVVSLSKKTGDEFTDEEIKKIFISSEQAIFTKESEYKGLTYCALGDSITYGYIPRNYPGFPGQLASYANLTARKLGMKFINYGISGSSVANLSGRSPMCLRYVDMPDIADVITVMGGTNDVRNGVSLGNMSDRGINTYYGALHTLIGGLYTKYIANNVDEGKKKKIVILTPIKLLDKNKSSLPNTIENNANVLENWDDWINAVKEVAAFYSLPCLDMYNLSNINPHINRTVTGYTEGYMGYYNPYITDGTHPTQEGAEMMSDVLVGFLKSLK